MSKNFLGSVALAAVLVSGFGFSAPLNAGVLAHQVKVQGELGSVFSDLSSSLTIKNASSSHYTLGVMAYVSLLVPVVLAYIFIVWRAIDSKKITQDEIKNDHHAY